MTARNPKQPRDSVNDLPCFVRPYGTWDLCPPHPQGCARMRGLHPGLFSMLPPGANARSLSPDITRVMINPVLFQDCQELCLEIPFRMVLLLSGDVGERGADLGLSNRERTIAFLPFEAFDMASFGHPSRRETFDLLHGHGNRQRRRQRQQQVHMVFATANPRRLHPMFSGYAAHIRPKARLNVSDDRFAPLLGGEDAMKQRATIGV